MEEERPIPEIRQEVEPPQPAVLKSTWFRRLSSVVFVVFCFEVGLFLLIYPWTDAWTENTISVLGRGEFRLPWRELWNNNYLRGAMSGMGLLNLWIAFVELFRLFRRQA
ncbi:MAG TPA: hypothetical protein VNH18_25680 [Bryobacteraceae bacterium]|nr:hypothetical protein [Bryobacteraceae bacterium]